MSKRNLMILGVSVVLAALLTIVVASAVAGGADHYEAPLRVHSSQDASTPVIGGSNAKLVTNKNGATVSINTTLTPGHAVTLWGVVVNNPSACANAPLPCTGADILVNTDAVEAQIAFATGHVVDEDGQLEFGAHLKKGVVPGGWYTGPEHDFDNPTGAEYHFVINDHGPMLPEYMPDMIHTYRGGCQDEGLPPFPPSALADGEPGPNTCRLVQFVIFQQ